MLLARMRRAAQRALVVGITTIRDLGDRGYLSLSLRDEFRDDQVVGPRILPSGPPLTVFLPAIGMTNAQALTATTADAADVCGIADTTGTLEPGKDADILAVAGNPLDDITAIHDVIAVYTRGTRAPQPN